MFKDTVFVTGAGFTRAFLPKAPLLIDDYGTGKLIEKFSSLPHAKAVIENEKRRQSGGALLNLERLLTRVDGRMPYDRSHQAEDELEVLRRELLRSFLERLEAAKIHPLPTQLCEFARRIVQSGCNVVTFNYDDVLDEALFDPENTLSKMVEHSDAPRGVVGLRYQGSYWHPDGGYGFYLRPSASCVTDAPLSKLGTPATLLLKLHGSVNWRMVLGAPSPCGLSALVHHETWKGYREGGQSAITEHLEPVPFIVPPVLSKTQVMEEPALRKVWTKAHEVLRLARRVVFMGYSCPLTDLAAGTLFAEAIDPSCEILVVNLAKDADVKKTLVDSYRRTFAGLRDLPDQAFHFDGVCSWLDAVLKKS